MKKFIFLFVFILILFPVIAYEPLTKKESKDWILSKVNTVEGETSVDEELIEFVIKYDLVEHSIPDIPMPDYVIIFTRKDVLLIPSDEQYIMTLGHLEYSIKYPYITYKDIVPRNSWLIPSLVGISIGITAASLLFLIAK